MTLATRFTKLGAAGCRYSRRRDLADEAVGETTVGGQQITLPKGHGSAPGAAATGHIGAMPMYAGESVIGVSAVEPAVQIIEAWCAAAQSAS